MYCFYLLFNVHERFFCKSSDYEIKWSKIRLIISEGDYGVKSSLHAIRTSIQQHFIFFCLVTALSFVLVKKTISKKGCLKTDKQTELINFLKILISAIEGESIFMVKYLNKYFISLYVYCMSFFNVMSLKIQLFKSDFKYLNI